MITKVKLFRQVITIFLTASLFVGSAASFNTFANDDPITDEDDGPGDDDGGKGCYVSYILQCPSIPPLFQGGQRKVCDFTGTYGAPTNCTETNCFANGPGNEIKHKCVKPTT